MTDNTSGNGTQEPEVSLDALATSLETVKTQEPDPNKPEAIELPDPSTDPEAFKKAVEENSTAIAENIDRMNSFMDKDAENKATAKLDGDINAAVDNVSSQIEGVDKNLIRAVLKDEADTNPAFKQIWDARDKNPTAFQKALGILANKYREQFAPRVDSQVESDLRAFQESIKAVRQGKETVIQSQNAEWAGKSSAEFDRDWNAMAGMA